MLNDLTNSMDTNSTDIATKKCFVTAGSQKVMK